MTSKKVIECGYLLWLLCNHEHQTEVVHSQCDVKQAVCIAQENRVAQRFFGVCQVRGCEEGQRISLCHWPAQFFSFFLLFNSASSLRADSRSEGVLRTYVDRIAWIYFFWSLWKSTDLTCSHIVLTLFSNLSKFSQVSHTFILLVSLCCYCIHTLRVRQQSQRQLSVHCLFLDTL